MSIGLWFMVLFLRPMVLFFSPVNVCLVVLRDSYYYMLNRATLNKKEKKILLSLGFSLFNNILISVVVKFLFSMAFSEFLYF